MLMRVLVADADAQNRELIRGLLINNGCETAFAYDQDEALKISKEFKPDIVLVDKALLKPGGLELLKACGDTVQVRGVRVAVMALPEVNQDEHSVKRAGFDGYLKKPVEAVKLMELVSDFRRKSILYGGKQRILCVDDEPLNLKLLEAILLPVGYDVASANDGYEALAVLKNEEVDLVLLDVMMPGMNGYDTCRLIKASAETSRVPVIMITALSSKEDRLKSIEAGAQDFITKPFEKIEVLTRIKQLLEIKEKNSKIISLYGMLSGLTERGTKSAESITRKGFDFFTEVDSLVRGTTAGQKRGPKGILLGTAELGWINYDMKDPESFKPGKSVAETKLLFLLDGESRVFYSNSGEEAAVEVKKVERALAGVGINTGNFICRAGGGLCVVCYDFLKPVNEQDSVILKAISMQVMFLKSVDFEIKEIEKAYDYIVFTLARVAEANDEDTGLHVLRVGEYAAMLAKKIGLDAGFVEKIRMQAQLHDVGKIQIPQEILRKPGPLSAEEFEIMKKHTTYGVKIIGRHERLSMGNRIAGYHHEKWDGSGYPEGLKGDSIPLEARITAVADQYDALRNARVYKPAFPHSKAFEIIAKGDGRSIPSHFDPDVLDAFIKNGPALEGIYNKLNG